MKGEVKYKDKDEQTEDYSVVAAEERDHKIEGGSIDAEKNTLVFLNGKRKKQIDTTLSTPDKYVSRFHYDGALSYLEEKEIQRNRGSSRRMAAGLTAGIVVISAGLYYLLFHVLSGVRV
ncbi:MAG: hypothetical protein PVH56_11610 [Desulfobacterales bacterium]|jgi:hypothetical protein